MVMEASGVTTADSILFIASATYWASVWVAMTDGDGDRDATMGVVRSMTASISSCELAFETMVIVRAWTISSEIYDDEMLMKAIKTNQFGYSQTQNGETPPMNPTQGAICEGIAARPDVR